MRSLATRLGLAALFAASIACTSLLELDAAQCTVAADCAARGAAFRDMVCVAGSCVRPGGGQDGRLGADGGAQNEVAASGAPTNGGCVSTAQCVRDNLDEPYACLKKGDPCVSLKTKECPLIFGPVGDDNAVYVGAFMNAPASAPLSQMSTLNVKLAIDEINGSVGGLPGGPLGKLRPVVAVVCRNEAAQVEAAAAHLLDGVGVQALLAHLPSADLKRLFVNRALPKKAFVMNPGFADNSLTSLSSEGLFWHAIGDIRDVAPAYAPLVARAERFLKADGAQEPLRVAMIVTKRFAEQSIADTLVPLLQFNGKSVVENGANFYTSSVTALADDPKADYASVNADLLAFAPNIVVAVAREEFVYKILPALEAGWPVASGKKRPFYVLPTALSGNLDLLTFVGQDTTGVTSENKRRRIVGVAPASAEDLTRYNQFLVRFRTAFPHFQNPGGFENFYDATYLLAYAMFAAGSVPALTGPDIARGMQRVVSGSLAVDIGPTHLADGFTALAAGGAIRLNGTMGLADFDPGVGARRGNGSVYCIARNGGLVSFQYDVLRYDRTQKALGGEFTCFPGF